MTSDTFSSLFKSVIKHPTDTGSQKIKWKWDRTLDKSCFPEFLTIHQSISKLVCAYYLGKMVEAASMKGKKTYFHRYSTDFCGFYGASLDEKALWQLCQRAFFM